MLKGQGDTELKHTSNWENSFINAETAEFMSGLESLSSKDYALVKAKFEMMLNKKVIHFAAEGVIDSIEFKALGNPVEAQKKAVKRVCDNIAYHLGQRTPEMGFIHTMPTPKGDLIISAAMAIYIPNLNQFTNYKYADDPIHQKQSGIIKEI